MLSTACSAEKSVQIEENMNTFAIQFLPNKNRYSYVVIRRPVF